MIWAKLTAFVLFCSFLDETIPAPLERFKVKPNKAYRFRVIQAGTIYPLRVSVDNHNLTVVASDGYDLTPVQCESFIINPGERFDFLLTTNQAIENYWIRIVSMEVLTLFSYISFEVIEIAFLRILSYIQ